MQKQLDSLTEQLKDIKAKCSQMKRWGVRFLSAFQGRNRQQLNQQYSKESLKNLLETVLKEFGDYTSTILNDEVTLSKLRTVLIRLMKPS